MQKYRACVISHGHLDIEWYQPLSCFAFWTDEAIERLLNQADSSDPVAPYALDGQVFPLEDYLSRHPGRRAAVEDLIRRGILRAGPFYTQFDEWIPDPEAMVRNCLWGTRGSAELGGTMRVGYLPDNFGHPLQLPQILNGFGIDTLLFMRGMPYVTKDYPDEFIYRGLDGSNLRAAHFRDGYSRIYGKNIENFAEDFLPQFRPMPYYGDYISYEHYMEMTVVDDPDRNAHEMTEYVRKVGPYFPSRVVPVMVGCDHAPPHVGLERAIERANHIQEEIQFEVSEPEAYCRAARESGAPLPVLREELIGTRFQFILLGALSTRAYIKRANFEAESLLIRYAEPLYTLTEALGLEQNAYGEDPLTPLWRELMINHAHDGIHGACADAVHDEMIARCHRIRQASAALSFSSMQKLAACLSDIAGPKDVRCATDGGRARERECWRGEDATEGSPQPRNTGRPKDVRCVTFDPSPDGEARAIETSLPVPDGRLCARDASGAPLACQVLRRDPPEKNDRGEDSALYYPAQEIRRVLVRLPEGGHQFSQIRLCPGAENPLPNPLSAGADFIENERLRVSLSASGLTVFDRATGRAYAGLATVREEAEAGDFWDSSAPWTQAPAHDSRDCAMRVTALESGPVRARMRGNYAMRVSERMVSGRRGAETVDIPVTVEVTLYASARRAEVRLEIDNRARDHKFTLDFAPGLPGKLTCQSVFAALTRNHARSEGACVQPATPVYPMRDWLAVSGPEGGLALAARGLYDYAPEKDERGYPRARLTLLRCVGNMSRIHMPARDGVAAWSATSENAQCMGRQVFEFAFLPLDAGESPERRACGYLYPPLAHVVRERGPRAPRDLPEDICAWDAPNVRLSAFKAAEDGDGFILRLWENQGAPTALRIRLPLFGSMRRERLDETPLSPAEPIPGRAEISLNPYEIVTLRLWPQQPSLTP